MTIPLILLLQLSSAFPLKPIEIFGFGSQSCARAFSNTDPDYVREWVAGFFSGANAAKGGMTGSNTDLDGIVGEVKLMCANEPSKPLIWAVVAAYDKLAARTK